LVDFQGIWSPTASELVGLVFPRAEVAHASAPRFILNSVRSDMYSPNLAVFWSIDGKAVVRMGPLDLGESSTISPPFTGPFMSE
jgi:hypothetical protein